MLLFEHKKICRVTKLKVHPKGRYFIKQDPSFKNYNEWLLWITTQFFWILQSHNGTHLNDKKCCRYESLLVASIFCLIYHIIIYPLYIITVIPIV